MGSRRGFVRTMGAAGLAARDYGQDAAVIRRIDIVHHTHTDVGYTDLPSVVRDKQIRYLDAAIELCRAQPGFRWTVESLVGLLDWWAASPEVRRKEFLGLVRGGRMDVMGLPFNQTPLLDALQWNQMMEWIPAGLWKQVSPRAAMQNDVNGFPRAGAMRLLDRGIRHLLMGINADSGGPPFDRPCAFWWKLPDGRRIFVWLGEPYGKAMEYLGFLGGDMPRDDEGFLRASHALCRKQLARLQSNGYAHPRLLLTFTHPKDYDNGSPFAPLAPFVERWNAAKLQPSLHLMTATQAVLELEAGIGGSIPTLEGEWTDWWVNGSASGPREIAASRLAKRNLAAALSPAWGPMPAGASQAAAQVLRDLCLFDEHTWGAAASISAPQSLNTLAQYNQKSELAYRPMGHAGWLLNRRIRTRLMPLAEGVYVANPTPAELSGWAVVTEGEKKKAVWVEKLPPHTFRLLGEEAPPAGSSVKVETDASGWPVRAIWPGMRKPLFDGVAGGFVRGGLIPPADRRTITRLHALPNAADRAALRAKSVRYGRAECAAATSVTTSHTIVYKQQVTHERIARAERSLELCRGEPRARLTLRFDRISSVSPEILYAEFVLPAGLGLPVLSCGGVPFTPYRDQLKGSCHDYYGIDGWAHYKSSDGHWLWVTRDAPLVCVGGPHMLERHEEEPAEPHRMAAMLFDNCWHTNFVADSHGAMEFQFELAWKQAIDRPRDLAEALASDPIVFTNPAEREHPALMETLFKP